MTNWEEEEEDDDDLFANWEEEEEEKEEYDDDDYLFYLSSVAMIIMIIILLLLICNWPDRSTCSRLLAQLCTLTAACGGHTQNVSLVQSGLRGGGGRRSGLRPTNH